MSNATFANEIIRYKFRCLTPKTMRFKADTVFSSPVFELMLSNCSIGYAEQVTLPMK